MARSYSTKENARSMFLASGPPIGSFSPPQEANSSQRSAVLGGSKHDQAGKIANLHQRAPCCRPRFRNMDRDALLDELREKAATVVNTAEAKDRLQAVFTLTRNAR